MFSFYSSIHSVYTLRCRREVGDYKISLNCDCDIILIMYACVCVCAMIVDIPKSCASLSIAELAGSFRITDDIIITKDSCIMWSYCLYLVTQLSLS